MPTVAIRILFETGSSDDPPGREGLCRLAARTLIAGGTRVRTRAEVADALYPLGARLDVQVDKDLVVFTAHGPAEALRDFYPLLRDLLLEPRWDPKDFAREKAAARNALENGLAGGDDEALARAALEAFLYGAGPYGHPTLGTLEGLEAITLEDVRRFAREHFVRARMLVGVAGNYPPEFPGRLMKDLSQLPEGSARSAEVPDAASWEGTEILAVERPEAPACPVWMGFPVAYDRLDPDYPALLLAGAWFGEHRTFFGRLMNLLRVQRGLNYGDYAYIEPFTQDAWTRFAKPNILRRSGFFSIWLRSLENENVPSAIRLAVDALRRFAREGIPEAEFEDAKKHVLAYTLLWQQGLHRRLGLAMDEVLLGRPGWWEEVRSRIAELTPEDVRQALRRHLAGRAIRMALVSAKAESLALVLRENRPSRFVYKTEVPESLRVEDERIANLALGVRRVVATTARDLIRRKRGW
jgi:zinc protease